MIRNKPNILSLERREVLLTKYVQTCKYVGIAVYNPVQPGTGKRLVISNETYSGKHDSIVRRGNGRYLRAKRSDRFSTVWMDSVGHQNHVSMAHGIDPDRRAREARVPKGSNRKQLAAI